jgi:hypothetical protein
MKKATMRHQVLHHQKSNSEGLRTSGNRGRGFTLIASLLMLLLLSGIAIGLMMMVNTEGRVGSTDLQNNVAFHSAEGGVEKMTSDLASAFNNSLAPTAAQICSLSTLQPSIPGVTWKDYTVMPGPIGASCPTSLITQYGQISSGPNQGLWAQIIPVNMLATASEPGGQEVSMTRSAQVALIPVFQFGIFSDSDLSFFSGPNFDFAGRIHTNGDLYPEVGPGSTLTFHDNISAYGNVIRSQLANGYSTATNYSGTVKIPTAAQGCDGTQPNCRAIGLAEGSITGAGGNPPQGTQISGWATLSVGTYHSEIIDGDYGLGNPVKYGTGAKKLSMPFVGPGNLPNEIIRVPPVGESPTGALGASREYNLAQIHVLLTDDPAELPGGAGDANNVRLANIGGAAPSNQFGIATSVPAGLPALTAGSAYVTYFAAGSNAIPDETPCANTNCPTANSLSSLTSDWPYAPTAPQSGSQTLVPTGAPIITGSSATGPLAIALCPPGNVASKPAGCPTTAAIPYYVVPAATASWDLIDGYLRVEYKDAGGAWHPVTTEWLKLGFARGQTPPTAAGTNPINPNAILLLQEPADRNGNGTVDATGIAPLCTKTSGATCTKWNNPLPPEVLTDTVSTSPWFGVTKSSTTTQSVSMTNWYPINFYDTREGETRDNDAGNNSCTTAGLMNAVEIDVGNLKQWLLGNIGTSGTSVDYVGQNGYVLYYSDRRGMLVNPNYGRKTGDSGLEDVVNSSSSGGIPDGVLEPIQLGQTISPEDVNQNGKLDQFGTANLGLGQYNGAVNQNKQIILAAPDNPYLPRITSCTASARKNWVSGARHVLKLVDGGFGNVPLSPVGTVADPGGFTVAAENPVYVQGNYNSSSADPTWTGGADVSGHSSAAVIADAVTFLSNSWSDNFSMTTTDVTAEGNRNATDTYYRLAIAGGKNINFPKPSWGANDFGTDGGVHNFLRYLENWGSATLHYKGSLVSLYYSTYNTGTFKCCTAVYGAPTRAYSFDLDFSTPQGLPPGTPLFRDVDSLGYRQLFTARTN